MASHLISFRVNDAELEALKQLAEGDESANLVAQRLLKERLGVSTGSSTDLSTERLDQLRTQIKAELVEELEGLQGNLRSLEDSVNARLETLEKKLSPSQAEKIAAIASLRG
jgi:hypothetical protein